MFNVVQQARNFLEALNGGEERLRDHFFAHCAALLVEDMLHVLSPSEVNAFMSTFHSFSPFRLISL